MKYNLKNRPQVPVCETENDRIRVVVKMDQWFRDFEKELRAELAILKPRQKTDPNALTGYRVSLIEEILGDEG